MIEGLCQNESFDAAHFICKINLLQEIRKIHTFVETLRSISK